jgi:acetyl/propionyl-CoA carboxylase alpha subunit
VQYEMEIGGRPRLVQIVRAGEGLAVTVDEHTVYVDAARIDAHTLSLIVDTVWPGSYDVSITPDGSGSSVTVWVRSIPIAVTLNGGSRWDRKEDGATQGSGPQRVAAPMPGKIIRVLVQTGDAVRSRQPLVVVEAMKMENELRAARDGTIAEVHAREGMSVDAGALLIVIQ